MAAVFCVFQLLPILRGGSFETALTFRSLFFRQGVVVEKAVVGTVIVVVSEKIFHLILIKINKADIVTRLVVQNIVHTIVAF